MPKINKHKKQISIVFIESISKMQVKKWIIDVCITRVEKKIIKKQDDKY